LSRLFISHSSKDNISAIAFRQWLGTNGWPNEDVFLDLDDIGAGERWKVALNNANTRCEAVILLASPDALSSPECIAEVRKAEDYGKEIIVVLLHDLQFDDHRLDSYKDRQIVDLAAPPLAHTETISYRGQRHEVHFNDHALASVKDYLVKRGITPDRFPWPPPEKPNAEPFPGLSAFTEDDAGIFFGRDSDILRGLDKVRLMRRNGRPSLLVIQAASGAGKSSYLRAGLWPRLNRDFDFAPIAVLRPAQGILTGPEGLGRKLAALLSRPSLPVSPGEIHAQLVAQDKQQAAEEFTRRIAAAAAQALEQRKVGDSEARQPAVILAIDQAEELLSADNASESERFLFLLANVMRAPPTGVDIYCLFTMRADGAARLFQTIADLNLEIPETLPLLPLPQSSYRDVILKPLEVLARRGQRLTLSPELVDRLVADATGADALPLLAFTISHLYREFSVTGSLTLQQYDSLGGIAGSIDAALKQALAKPADAPAIPVAKEEQLLQLRSAFIPWLARIDPNTGVPMRRVARLDEIPLNARAMVERLIEVRLLAVDRRSDADVVEVAHESLLRQWPTLTAWLQAEADNLKLLEDVERAAAQWERRGRLDAWIDHRAERLYLVETLSTRPDFHGRFGKTVMDYIVACRAHESRLFRKAGVDLLPLGLERAGLETQSFSWPPPNDSNRPPFPGLRAFTTEDAAIFFGRDRDILRALERIRAFLEGGSENFLIILGASGVGKSSFLHAGLWPRLARYSMDFILLPVIRADSHEITNELASAVADVFERFGVRRKREQVLETLSIGASGVDQLLGELIGLAKLTSDRSAPTIVLPIDQIEHLFVDTQKTDRFRDLLADMLASTKRVFVAATMRSDKYHMLESDHKLSSIKQELFNLPPLRDAELNEAICQPAERAAFRYETNDIAAKLAHAAAEGASSLPLLAFLLEGMWMQSVARGDRRLVLPTDGLSEVISERAESFLASHIDSGDLIRNIFIPRLVRMTEDFEPMRRLARRSEFSEEDWRLVMALADYPYRLLVVATHESDEAFAEVAHDLIFRSWPRLRSWIDGEREFLGWRGKIESAYRTWQVTRAQSKNDALLVGLALAEAESWAAKRANQLDGGLQQYIYLSKRRGLRRQRRAYVLAIVFALFGVVTLLAASGSGLVAKHSAGTARYCCRTEGSRRSCVAFIHPREPACRLGDQSGRHSSAGLRP
jgi:hypothetical protein